MIRGKIRSKYGVKVRRWDAQLGKPLPMPLLEDDRQYLPAETVKEVSAWLESRKPEFEKDPTPTPIILTMSAPINARTDARSQPPVRLTVRYGKPGDPPEKMRYGLFTAQTIEVILRPENKPKLILAKYHYLAARDEKGRCIVGPHLRTNQQRLVTLAS
jgi:hypothetical protein